MPLFTGGAAAGILGGGSPMLSSFAISNFIGGVSVHSCAMTSLEMLNGSVAFRSWTSGCGLKVIISMDLDLWESVIVSR